MTVSYKSFHRIVLSLFFTLSSITGFFSIVGMFRLPKSEADSAILFGYSELRLAIFSIQIVIVFCLACISWFCFSNQKFGEFLNLSIKKWLRRFEFIAATIFLGLIIWIILCIMLEFFLDSNRFPRAVLYLNLYSRIRPIILWVFSVSFFGIFLIILNDWFILKKIEEGRISRNVMIGITGMFVTVLMTIGLWIYYNSIPTPNSYGGIGINAIIIITLIMLFFSLHFISWKQRYDSLAEIPGNTDSLRRKGWLETIAYGCLLMFMLGMYIYTGYFVTPLRDPNNLNSAALKQTIFGFGFKQFQYVPIIFVIAFIIFLAGGVYFLRLHPQIPGNISKRINDTIRHHPIYLFVIACLFFVATYFFRTNVISADMEIYMGWLPTAIQNGSIHVRLDEIWESNLHFSLFAIFNYLFGWDTTFTFQLVSCLTAPFFLVFLYRFSHKLVNFQATHLVILLMSGGYVQLFFGDMEYYTVSIMITLIYFLVADAYIRGEIAFPVPAMILALAMSFHFVNLFLITTLIFLTIIDLYRRSYITLISGWIGLITYIALIVIFFGFNGASVTNMRDTSWGLGRAGHILANFMAFEPLSFFSRLNMFAVIFPLFFVLILILLFRRIHLSAFNAFLGIGALFGIPFALTWVSMIGLYSDWNLFSIPLFPAIMLISYNLIRNVNMPYKKELLFCLISLSCFVTYIWIIRNHYLG